MHGAGGFLRDLALVLCTAAVTTVLFQRLRQPVVLGYLLAGMIVGPHVLLPPFADVGNVEILSEIGVVMLMFALGLEFSPRKLLRIGAAAALVAVVQVSVMLWLGYSTARALGWTVSEALYAGAALSISSTTIIAKVFDEERVERDLRDLVFAVLIVEDLIAILLLAGLTTLGSGFSAATLARTAGELAAFLVGLVVLGLLVVPRAVRFVVHLGRPETTLVATIGLCFACALLAQSFGYSVALGAFIAGSLVADSGEVEKIEPLVTPVRDMFAAVFFVSVGMLIDPGLIAEHWVAVVVLTAIVVLGKLAGVAVGAFLAGRSVRTSLQAGFSMAQIGEFSFIIASLGLALGATREFLYPVTVAVSAVTTMTTPWLIRASEPIGRWVDRRSPRAVRTFETLYATWLERVKPRRAPRRTRSRGTRLAAWIAVDALAICAIVIGVALMSTRLEELVTEAFAGSVWLAEFVILLGTVLACSPFAAGIVVQTRRLAQLLAVGAFRPTEKGAADFAAAPRRSFTVALQLAIVLAIGLPMLAVIQPFVPWSSGVVALILLLAAMGVAFWRSVSNLEGHVRAGAQVVAEAIGQQSRASSSHDLKQVSSLLPGMGRLTPLSIAAGSASAGATLRELDLLGRTGASVVCLSRDGRSVIAPEDGERVLAGDTLVLTGTEAAIERARAVLERPRAQ